MFTDHRSDLLSPDCPIKVRDCASSSSPLSSLQSSSQLLLFSPSTWRQSRYLLSSFFPLRNSFADNVYSFCFSDALWSYSPYKYLLTHACMHAHTWWRAQNVSTQQKLLAVTRRPYISIYEKCMEDFAVSSMTYFSAACLPEDLDADKQRNIKDWMLKLVCSWSYAHPLCKETYNSWLSVALRPQKP